MKIGDEVYVHGYVDEIRNGTIIIRNEGGYFGTAPDEVMPSVQPEIIRCKDCRKHNISPRYDQENCCPLYHYRGMSFGSEHDLQFCSYAERREDAQ